MSAIPHVSPSVVRLQLAIEPITQVELALLLSLRNRLHQLEAQVVSAEESIKQRLEQGAGVEIGAHTARLETGFRRNVSWKSVTECLAERFQLNGKVFTAHILEETEPTAIVSLELH